MAVEPWPGYAQLSESERKEQLNFKVEEARLRSDVPYAHAVAAAVANFEALERGDDAPGTVEKAAEAHVTTIEEAGGWGHG